MQKVSVKSRYREDIHPEIEGTRVGRVVNIEKYGQVWVNYPDNHYGPIRARLTRSIKINSLQEALNSKREVLLLFENNDPKLPIIIDTLYSIVDEIIMPKQVTVETDMPKDIIMDGKRMVFNAKEEIVLKCGKGRITIRKNGKIVIKGTNLLSRSAGANKIKGGSVNIN